MQFGDGSPALNPGCAKSQGPALIAYINSNVYATREYFVGVSLKLW